MEYSGVNGEGSNTVMSMECSEVQYGQWSTVEYSEVQWCTVKYSGLQ